MHQRRILAFAAPLLITSVALTACGSKKEATTGGSSSGKTVVIGLSAPLSGAQVATGAGSRNAVDLAIKQANDSNKVPGWKLVLNPQDDQAKADVGGQVASKLQSAPDVVGVIGTLNSSVAQQEQKIFSDANIAMISPANTNTTLTQGSNPAAPTRPYKNYFRVITTDAIQGPFGAQYGYQSVGKTAAIVTDGKAYGVGLAEAFATEFKKEGGQIVAQEKINPGDTDLSGVCNKIKPLSPSFIYYGGEYPESSKLSPQCKSTGLAAPVMGGDGIYAPEHISLGGQSTEGDLATNPGADVATLASAKSFTDAYKAAGYKEEPNTYGATSYDAANALIGALAKVLPGKSKIDDATKKALIDAVQQTNFDGVTGKVSFDQYGDTQLKILTVYKVTGGKWVAAKTDVFKG